MHYLVTEYEYFIDPHGSADSGGVKKFVTSDPRYLKWVSDDDEMYYNGDGEFIHSDNLRGSEDGYNSTTHQYTVREITEEEAKTAQLLIDSYNML